MNMSRKKDKISLQNENGEPVTITREEETSEGEAMWRFQSDGLLTTRELLAIHMAFLKKYGKNVSASDVAETERKMSRVKG
jgi:hypothetical protein